MKYFIIILFIFMNFTQGLAQDDITGWFEERGTLLDSTVNCILLHLDEYSDSLKHRIDETRYLSASTDFQDLGSSVMTCEFMNREEQMFLVSDLAKVLFSFEQNPFILKYDFALLTKDKGYGCVIIVPNPSNLLGSEKLLGAYSGNEISQENINISGVSGSRLREKGIIRPEKSGEIKYGEIIRYYLPSVYDDFSLEVNFHVIPQLE
ncbi:MAG: hypothetical protein AAFN93_09370 [Bacteroidota bacterium]